MALVRRLFVEKKEGFDLEAGRVLADLRDTLGIPGLEALRLFNRYDVEGLGGADFDTAAATILSEPNADRIYDRLPDMDASLVFAVEYLPGQYDQRADSAAHGAAVRSMAVPRARARKNVCSVTSWRSRNPSLSMAKRQRQ